MENTDVKNIQTNEVVVGTTTEPKAETAIEPKPLTMEMIKELVKKEVEEGKKHFQSIADRDIKAAKIEANRAIKRAEFAESSLNEINKVAYSNPQLASALQNATVTAKSRIFEEQDRREQLEQIRKNFVEDMSEAVAELGVDTKDTRIDWGEDAPTPAAATKRIMSSVTKILKENAKTEKGNLDKQGKELESKIRKELGLDQVDNLAPVGTGSKSGLSEVLGNAKNASDARRKLDEFVKGA